MLKQYSTIYGFKVRYNWSFNGKYKLQTFCLSSKYLVQQYIYLQ